MLSVLEEQSTFSLRQESHVFTAGARNMAGLFFLTSLYEGRRGLPLLRKFIGVLAVYKHSCRMQEMWDVVSETLLPQVRSMKRGNVARRNL